MRSIVRTVGHNAEAGAYFFVTTIMTSSCTHALSRNVTKVAPCLLSLYSARVDV